MTESGGYGDDCYIDWTAKLLDDRYVAIKKLGYGSFSSVWLAFDCHDKKYYAIKIHNRPDYDIGEKETRIYDDISKFNCNSLMTSIRTFDYDNDDSENDETYIETHKCLVMNLMACSTYDLIKSDDYYNGLPLKWIIQITKSLLEATEALHKNGYIHTDIKPENILIEGMSDDIKNLISKINIDKPKKKKGGYKNIMMERIKKIMSETPIDNQDIDNKTSDSTSNSDDTKSIHLYSDSDDDRISLSSHSDDSNEDNYVENTDTFKIVIDRPKIKLTDMGTCIEPNTKRTRQIQTRYYRSPEILLGLKYNEKCDMWSIGCTVYELLTGKILFNPCDVDSNKDRHHIYMIVQMFGMIPKHMINLSPYKDFIFTPDGQRLRGYKQIVHLSFIRKIFGDDKEKWSDQMILLVDLISKLLELNPENRLGASQALLHPVFKFDTH